MTMTKNSKTLLGTLAAVGLISLSVTAYAATTTPSSSTSSHAWSATSGFHHGRGPGGMGNLMTTLAKDLNISTSTLQSDLKSGKTIASIAQAQGVSTSTLITDLETTATANLAQAVSSNKLTSTQEQQMVANIDQRITDFVNGTMPQGIGHGPGGFGGPGGMGNLMTTVAKDLNISTSTLQSDLKSGKSIASIAQAQGVSTATLITDLETAATANLAQAVSSNKLTSTQEQQMAANIDQRITDFVNGTMPQGRGHGSGGPGCPGGKTAS